MQQLLNKPKVSNMKKKFSQVFQSIRFAKLDPNHDKGPKGSSDDEEHYAIGQKEWAQQIAHAKKRAMQEDKAEFKPEWSKTGKEAVHRETGEKTHEYAEIGHDGKPTGKREYRNTQGKPMGESTQQTEGAVPSTEKVVTIRHKDSGKELVVTAQKAKEYQQQGYHPVKEEVKSFVPSPNSTPVPKKPKGEYERKVDKYLKKKYNKEEVEHLEEGRPSQRHPLEGHEYHKKSDEALVHIAKDAHAAAEAMKGHNTTAENKYRDQANDSATVRHFRKTSGMPEWYKKKYGHIKEAKDEGEYGYEGDMALNQLATLTRCADMIKDLLKPDTDMPEWVQSKITLATDYIQTAADYMYSEMKDMKEDVPFDGPYKKTTGVVTDKSGAKHGPMSQARNLARQAMKAVGDKQKKSLKPAKSFAESKKTEIVKDVIKGKKMKDKFEAEPIISSSPDTKGTIDN
jgi:hypothetical protein